MSPATRRKSPAKIELLVATRNKKKLQEIKEILRDLNLKITSLDDHPGMPEIVEDGTTFEENAIKKAKTIADITKTLVMGEDSGLEVRALKMRPGIYSARYSGPGANDEKNNQKLLKELAGVPLKKRSARYKCVAALADAKGVVAVVSGTCSGLIGFKPRGKSGFGYDPLFIIKKYNKTFGELGPEIKHKISHRYKALKKTVRIMEGYLRRSHRHV
ncbi:MAG TPA: XTP/dITP diphosphatase [Candidatus Omnitrophota bacterium]|nr:XTP/dITP diphosphatase [Candidatus Omnitrophota bacterium]